MIIMKIRVVIFSLLIILGLAGLLQSQTADTVYRIDIAGDIDMGLAAITERGIREAEEAGAAAVLIYIDTFGGLVDASTRIRDAIFRSSLPVYTYVGGRAWSAGALIAMAGDYMAMTPGSSIGAAEPQPADEKTISALRSEFRSTAEARGRNPDIAMAMVDESISIEGLIGAGQILTLSAVEAERENFSDGTKDNISALLNEKGLGGATLVKVEPLLVEQFARAVAGPLLSGLLLTIGFAGIFLEVVTVGWGVPGTLGVLALAAFFTGHLLTGASHWSVAILFVAGLILIFMEIFVVPGFGITGAGGLIAMLVSLFLIFPDPGVAVQVIALSLLASIAIIMVGLKFLPSSGVWSRIALGTSETVDMGYVAPTDRSHLMNKEGVAVSYCRPSGIVEVEGERVDAISEGGYIDRGASVKVVKVEGTRVIVREIKE